MDVVYHVLSVFERLLLLLFGVSGAVAGYF